MMKSYEEIGFQAVWEGRVYIINGEKWYCFCAFPESGWTDGRLHLTKGEFHQASCIHADFDIHHGQSETVNELYENEEDISKHGNLYLR